MVEKMKSRPAAKGIIRLTKFWPLNSRRPSTVRMVRLMPFRMRSRTEPGWLESRLRRRKRSKSWRALLPGVSFQ